MDMNNEQLAGWSGGVNGFADAFLNGIKAKQEREDAQSKYAAYLELQREMQGPKHVTGSELKQYGAALGIPAEQLQGFVDETPYNTQLGKEWIDKLVAQRIAAGGETGKNKRAEEGNKSKEEQARIRAAAKAAADDKKNKSWNPTKTSNDLLDNLMETNGYKRGTPLAVIAGDPVKANAIRAAYVPAFNAAAAVAGQQDTVEAVDPFTQTPGAHFWNSAKLTPNTPFRTKKVGPAALAANPAGNVGADPLAAQDVNAAPAAPISADAVGADRSALKASFRKVK